MLKTFYVTVLDILKLLEYVRYVKYSQQFYL